jgi:hypothetical protein
MIRLIGVVLLAVAVAAGPARPLAAQAACSTPNTGNRQTRSCTVTLTGTLTLPAQAEVTLSRASTDIAGGGVATDAIFQAAGDTGIVVIGPLMRVSANRGVSVTLVNAPTFTGPVNKPASDVQLGVSPTSGLCAGVPTAPLSTSALAVQQSAPRVLLQSTEPLQNVQRQLCLRVRWFYATDLPGVYTLPLTVNVTAP